jgi:hypothetical protein
VKRDETDPVIPILQRLFGLEDTEHERLLRHLWDVLLQRNLAHGSDIYRVCAASTRIIEQSDKLVAVRILVTADPKTIRFSEGYGHDVYLEQGRIQASGDRTETLYYELRLLRNPFEKHLSERLYM